MNEDLKGKEITKVFRYIQQVFKECQQLIYKTDNLMAPDWKVLYGSRITRDVTSSIYDPERWLVEAIFRIYESDDKLVNKGITISFWGDIDEPVITAGKITYSDVSKRNHWDLWDIWYRWSEECKDENNTYEINGKINTFTSKDSNYVKEAKVFSYPLVSLKDDKELEEKIVKVLREL